MRSTHGLSGTAAFVCAATFSIVGAWPSAEQDTAAGPEPPVGYDSSSTPLFADPVFDAAHDPEFVWSEREQTWWVAYLQNRYNSPLSDPAGACPYCALTDIGLASTPNRGRTWIYRGVARGLDLPVALREAPINANGTQQFGGATWYRPAILKTALAYHGFWVYTAASSAGPAQFKVVHYTSSNLKNWSFVGTVTGDHGYDSVVYHTRPNGRTTGGRFVLMSTNSPGEQAFESTDLSAWRPINASDKQLNRQIGEGPHVMEWHGAMWLNWEGCPIPYRSGPGCITGPGLLRSVDGGESWVQVSLSSNTFVDIHVRKKDLDFIYIIYMYIGYTIVRFVNMQKTVVS